MRLAIVFIALMLTSAACQRVDQGALDRLHPCRIAEGPPDAYCGTYRVFENRTANAGRTIDLKIVVAPALRRDPEPDPLFVFEGGPGGGAATLAAQRIPMFRRFQTDRDIVLIDQRGTGGSNPLDCAADDADDDLRQVDEYPVERFRTCLETLTADASFYTTAIAMDDVDDVRRFLGYEQVNLWGGSYGTRAALVYLKRHERAVRAVVLDGVAPPDMRIPLFMARDGQRALDRLLDDCAHDADGCAKAYPQLRATVAALWVQLAQKPRITIPHPRTGMPTSLNVSQRLIATIVFQSLYSPEVAALLPQLLTDAAHGNFQGLLALAFAADLPKGAMSEGLFLSVVCAEDMPRISAEDITRETAGGFIGSAMFDTRMKPCAFWPKGPVADDYYAPVTSSKPVLLFSGEDDPVTPPSWGEHVRQSLANSRHVVVPGAGHITLMRGCVPDLVDRFLQSASVAGLDASCLTTLHRPPFFTSYTGPESRR
ncbi:MAG TPA: alpha/beta hydrolase [Vicinamibacterales bacterium]|nr:alpha/beta hydrolase [Vicinamibacterales bacterium]